MEVVWLVGNVKVAAKEEQLPELGLTCVNGVGRTSPSLGEPFSTEALAEFVDELR